MAKDKVVLAYSGGLDTTVIIPWLKENYDYLKKNGYEVMPGSKELLEEYRCE